MVCRTSRCAEFAWWVSLVAAAWMLASPGCASTPQPDNPSPSPSPQPSPDTNRRFERALERLEAGKYNRAHRLFEELSSERATLYAARASLGDISSSSPSEPSPRGLEGAIANLRRLAEGEASDDELRRVASLYLGVALVQADRIEDAYTTLNGVELGPADGDLPTSALERDRLPLRAMLVERAFRAKRGGATIRAASRVYRLVSSKRDGDQGDEQDRQAESSAPDEPHRRAESTTRDEGGQTTTLSTRDGKAQEAPSSPPGEKKSAPPSKWTTFATSRAFEAASTYTSPETLESLLASEAVLTRAVAGWAHLDRQLQRSDHSERERRELERLYRRMAPDLNQIGASDRVAELSTDMATLGGKRRLVIGVLLPLSGSNQSIGRRVMAGMLLAARAFETRQSSRVTLVFEDSNDDPEALFSTFRQREVTAVVGPLDDARARTLASHARRTNIPMLALTARPLEEGGVDDPFVFRNFMAPAAEARAVARIAFEELGDRRAVVLHPSVGYGTSLQRAFAETFRELGGQVVTSLAYDRSQSDFTSLAERAADARPDVVFIPDTASKAAEISAFLADQSIWGIAGEPPEETDRQYVHYLGTSLWYDPILTRQASDYVRGAVVPSWFAPVFQHSPTRRFVRRFRAVFDRTPKNMEAFGFDSIAWVRRLMLDRGLHTPENLRAAWLDGTSFQGATGTVSFDERGRARRTLRFVTPTEEGFEPLSFSTDVSVGRDDGPEATEVDEPPASPEEASSSSRPTPSSDADAP